VGERQKLRHEGGVENNESRANRECIGGAKSKTRVAKWRVEVNVWRASGVARRNINSRRNKSRHQRRAGEGGAADYAKAENDS